MQLLTTQQHPRHRKKYADAHLGIRSVTPPIVVQIWEWSTVNAAYVTVTAVTIALLVLISIPDYIPATFVLKTSSEVRVPRAWLPWLATLKLAGAGGLSVGLAGNFVEQPTLSAASTVIATCAGVGLVMFFCGAVIFHVRAHVFYNIWFPATYLLLCLTSLIFVLAH